MHLLTARAADPSLLLSAMQTFYFAAVMEVKTELDHEGWKAQRNDQEMIRGEIRSRFGGLKKPFLAEMVDKVKNVFFYPVYVLSPGAKWSTGRNAVG